MGNFQRLKLLQVEQVAVIIFSVIVSVLETFYCFVTVESPCYDTPMMVAYEAGAT